MSDPVKYELSTDDAGSWDELHELGIENAVLRYVASGKSSMSFTIKGVTALTDDNDFAYESAVRIRRVEGEATTPYFYGLVQSVPRRGLPDTESQQISLACPWLHLEQCTYRQSWKLWDTDSESEVTDYMERVVLFQDSDGNRTTAGAQITDAVNWAISQGAHLQLGSVYDGIQLPFDERENIKCSDVIYTVLRGQPDLEAWLDFSTTPYPTLNVTRKADMPAVNLTTGEAPLHSVGRITPRYDSRVPGIRITYQKTHSNNGTSFRTIETDTAGNVSALKSVSLTYDLVGTQRTWQSQHVKCAAVPDPLTSKAWWKKRDPWLADVNDADLTLSSGTFKDAETGADLTGTYSVYLIEGTVHDWMNEDYTEAIISCKADGVIRDDYDDKEVETVKGRVLSVRVLATKAAEGEPDLEKTYWRLTSLQSGEATPTGVAARLYAAWNTLHYEGSARLKALDCDATYRPGTVLNIAGGRSEWSSMAALIQQVEQNLFAGTTDLTFGPPRKLQADTVLALFRHARNRQFSYSRLARNDSDAETENTVASTGTTPVHDATDGHGRKARLVIKHSTDNDGRLIDLNPDSVNTDGPVLQPRDIYVVDSGGVTAHQRSVVASEPFGDAIDLGGFSGVWGLSDRTDTTFKMIEGYFFIQGDPVSVTYNTSWPDDVITVTCSCYIYVDIHFQDLTATLHVGNPGAWTADDQTFEERFRLWYIAWDSAESKIDWSNCLDLRYEKHAAGF